MIQTVLFDLCEVYLQGLVGVERELSNILGLNAQEILTTHLKGEKLILLFEGKISEDEYWARVITDNDYPSRVPGYASTHEFLKAAIRRNFTEIAGTRTVIEWLKERGYSLGFLSDHAQEWVEYVESVHPLKSLFAVRCYSFQTGATKKKPQSFQAALARCNADPKTTLFIDDQMTNLVNASSPPVNILHTHRFIDAPSLEQTLLGFGIRL